jgi:hypothetical protein
MKFMWAAEVVVGRQMAMAHRRPHDEQGGEQGDKEATGEVGHLAQLEKL